MSGAARALQQTELTAAVAPVIGILRQLDEFIETELGDQDAAEVYQMIGKYAATRLHETEERRQRIAIGLEHRCISCGCSDSRACAGGCVWAGPNLCSRCV